MSAPQSTSHAGREPLAPVDRERLLERASSQLSALPRPLLRWAGSKRKLLPDLADVLPTHYRCYREPFFGGGSLFFLLEPEHAVLSDACEELISTYDAVRRRHDVVLRHLSRLRVDRDTFYAIRSEQPRSQYKRAANFIYLNKTCWNGLYRVNSDGRFNVPFGAPRTANIVERTLLEAVAGALRKPGVTCLVGDFELLLADAMPGDLVFLDPPYVTRHNNNGFIDYNERLFSWEDQERLAREARRLAELNVHVVITNARHCDVLELYDGFYLRTSERASTLAASNDKRGRVQEAIFWYGPPAPL
jgi:DNA adenine methylase